MGQNHGLERVYHCICIHISCVKHYVHVHGDMKRERGACDITLQPAEDNGAADINAKLSHERSPKGVTGQGYERTNICRIECSVRRRVLSTV